MHGPGHERGAASARDRLDQLGTLVPRRTNGLGGRVVGQNGLSGYPGAKAPLIILSMREDDAKGSRAMPSRSRSRTGRHPRNPFEQSALRCTAGNKSWHDLSTGLRPLWELCGGAGIVASVESAEHG